MVKVAEFYGGVDPRDVPLYGITEAAKAVDKVPKSTLRTWCSGSTPVISPADLNPMTLSFNNLVEARVLRALRVTHSVQMNAIKTAIAHAEEDLNVDRLLLRKDLRTDGASLLIQYYGQYVQLNPGKQMAMKKILDSVLSRIDWDEKKFAKRFYPSFEGDERKVFIDPLYSFGKAVISKRYISTQVISQRVNAGEPPEDVARDYRITQTEVEQAVVFEEAA